MIILPGAVDLGRVSRSAQGADSIGEASGILLAILGVFAAYWLLMFLWGRYRRELARAASDPRTLFYELCRAHQLNRRERSLLWSAAVRYRLEHPALVFALPHYLNQLAGPAQPRSEAYARLAVRLFGSVGDSANLPPTDDALTAEREHSPA